MTTSISSEEKQKLKTQKDNNINKKNHRWTNGQCKLLFSDHKKQREKKKI